MITTDNDRISFSFFRPNASSVHIAASFNNWSPSSHPMNPLGNGWWQLTLLLDPGDHSFQYIEDGQKHYADFAAHGVELDELGGWRSILTVDERVSTQKKSRPELLRVVEESRDPLSTITFTEADPHAPKRQPNRRAA